jgi:hypothetical protein
MYKQNDIWDMRAIAVFLPPKLLLNGTNKIVLPLYLR